MNRAIIILLLSLTGCAVTPLTDIGNNYE